MKRALLLLVTVLGCSRTTIAPEKEEAPAQPAATLPPAIPSAPQEDEEEKTEACETERIDDLCAFLKRVTEGLASKDPASLACPRPEGKPRVAWGSRKCVASSVGPRVPFVCELDWPGDDRIAAALERDGRSVSECLKGWEVSKKERSFEAKGEKVRCELLVRRPTRSYGLACSRRNL